jgi:hypothetical protein
VTKLHAKSIKIRLLNIKDSVPSIEALVHEGVEVLGQAQLPKYGFKFSSHVGGCLVLHEGDFDDCLESFGSRC